MPGIQSGTLAGHSVELQELTPLSVKSRWPGLAEALQAGAPPPFRPIAPPWRDEPGLDDDEDLRKVLCDVRSAQRSLFKDVNQAEGPRPATTQTSLQNNATARPGTTNACLQHFSSGSNPWHTSPLKPMSARLGQRAIPSQARLAPILPKVGESAASTHLATLGMVPNSGRSAPSSAPARPYTTHHRGRKQKAVMPPVSNWLRRELSKVKLGNPHTQSSSTLPSMDSVMSCRTASSSAPGQMPDEQAEVKQMLFLQNQFGGGCATIMRGRAEELLREHQRFERERIHLLSAEIRGMRHAQRVSAREQREARKDVVHLEDHRMLKDTSASSIGSERRQVVETTATKKKKSVAAVGSRKAQGKFAQVTNRITVLNFLKHRSTWKDRRSAVDKLRNELKRKAQDAVSVIASDVGENWNPNSADLGTDSDNVKSFEKTVPGSRKEQEEERKANARCTLKEMPQDAAESDTQRAYLEAFQRYDAESCGMLDGREVRAAMADVGIEPLTMQEKRAITKLIVGTLENSSDDGIDFETFVALIPRWRDTMHEIMHEDLEEWYNKGLDDRRHYDINRLQPCLLALGSKNAAAEADWKEVLSIFEGFNAAVALSSQKIQGAHSPEHGMFNGTAASLACVLSMQKRSSQGTIGSPSNAFDLFEVLFHRARERLTVLRREKERKLAKDLNIPDAQFNAFRSDVLELNSYFKEFDTDQSDLLKGEDIRKCLATCGMMPRRGGVSQEVVDELVVQAKIRTDKMRRTPARCEILSDSNSGSENVSRRSSRQLSEQSIYLHVDFSEFLALMVLVRRRNRLDIRPELRQVFNSFDREKSGQIEMNMNLFNELSLQPKTKGEQLEIRTMLDEVDENGDGTFCFEEFELLVHRVHEHLDRMTRLEELHFAMQLGFEQTRGRDLRDLYHSFVEPSQPTLIIADLRQVMERLHYRYTSDALLELFHEFAREEKHGVDCLGFFRMMHAVEIAKTHGQEKQRNSRISQGSRFLQILKPA